MLIAIDYDQTYTRDPDFWDSVIASGVSRGHRFVCVTNRTYAPGSTKPERTPSPAIPVVCAGHEMKQEAAIRAGFNVHVWIDDTPASISQAHILAPASVEFSDIVIKAPSRIEPFPSVGIKPCPCGGTGWLDVAGSKYRSPCPFCGPKLKDGHA